MSNPDPGEKRNGDPNLRIYVGAALVAILYGLFSRFFFGLSNTSPSKDRVSGVFGVMSVAFIFLVPFAIGFLSTFLAREKRLARALFIPILPALTSLFVALMLAWEGLICIFLWLPLFVIMSILGGFVGFLVVRFAKDGSGRAALGFVTLLPFAASFPESLFDAPKQIRRVETSIEINATPDAVWEEIVSVPAIRGEEHAFSWSHFIGFPRPIAAESL
jgi:hypothetical protein